MNARLVHAMTAGLFASAAAHAIVIESGEIVLTAGTTAAQSPWLTSASPAYLGFVPIIFYDNAGAPVFAATVHMLETRLAPLNTRTLYFVTDVTYTTGGRGIEAIEIDGYERFDVDVDYRTDLFPLGVPVQNVYRSADGDRLEYRFSEPVGHEMETPFVFAHANATQYDFTGRMLMRLNTGESAYLEGIAVPVLRVEPTCDLDTNNDNIINFADLNGVLSAFGQLCP